MTSYTINRLGQQGDGIADGPIYAPLTLPGEVVTGDLDGNRLSNVKIETPSPDRVSAPCRHFRSCGGCQLQHASDDFLAGWKTEVVSTALAAHGLEAVFLPISTSPPQSRSRARSALPRRATWLLVALFATATPLGGLIGTALGASVGGALATTLEAAFLSIAAGTFVYVATFDILRDEFPSPGGRLAKWAILTIGVSLMSALAFWL